MNFIKYYPVKKCMKINLTQLPRPLSFPGQ